MTLGALANSNNSKSQNSIVVLCLDSHSLGGKRLLFLGLIFPVVRGFALMFLYLIFIYQIFRLSIQNPFGLYSVSEFNSNLAQFLRSNLSLDKAMIGEYLGHHEEFPLSVMHAYVDSMKFSGMKFDIAIRELLKGFRLPGEAQKIDRIMEKFAERYYADNSGLVKNADIAYVLANFTWLVYAWSGLEYVILEHFDQVVGDCFMDCVNCLIRFANNRSSHRISLKAIALLRICEDRLAEMGKESAVWIEAG